MLESPGAGIAEIPRVYVSDPSMVVSGADEPEAAEPLEVTDVSPGEHHWRVIRDLATNESVIEVVNDQGEFVIDAQLDAHELDAERGDPRVFSRSWARRTPRDLV